MVPALFQIAVGPELLLLALGMLLFVGLGAIGFILFVIVHSRESLDEQSAVREDDTYR